MSGDLVPEEAIEAAKRADHKARNTAMFKASDSISIQDDAVRAVLEAAAPLLLAAELDRLALDLRAEAEAGFANGWLRGIERHRMRKIAERYAGRASVLRGEGQAGA